MGENSVKAELEGALPGDVSARRLAAAALERSSLAAYYSAEFATQLSDGAGGEEEPSQTVGAWIEAAESNLPGPPETGDRVYLALVLVSAGVAEEFARARPDAAGFDRICTAFTDDLTHQNKERWDDLVAGSPTLPDRRQHPVMAGAVESGEAEFSLLGEARTYQQEQFLPNESANRTYKRFYPAIRRAFEARHGQVLEEYWCGNVALGVVRTTGGRSLSQLHFDGNYNETVGEVINRCKEVYWQALEFLPPAEYEAMVRDLYGLLTDLFATIDRVAVLGTDGKSTYAVDSAPFLKRLEELEADVARAISRRGQRWYIAGTVIGLLGLSIVLALLALLSLGDWKQIFEGAIFGAAGALASVLYRMHRGDLAIDAQQGRLLVYTGALVRPLTGALFGGVISALLLSGLLPIEVPADKPERFYFLAVLSFIAGFSERWAPDLLQLTADSVSAKAKPAEEQEDEEEGDGEKDEEDQKPAANAPA